MDLITINLHSAVDVITNSSTTIYTYSEGSPAKAKELINELLKVLGSDLTADQMFYMGVFADKWHYLEKEYDYDEDDDGNPIGTYGLPKEWFDDDTDMDLGKFVDDAIKDVISGKERPEWMTMVDDEESQGSTLMVLPKAKKYTEVAKKITEFLYSTECEEGYN